MVVVIVAVMVVVAVAVTGRGDGRGVGGENYRCSKSKFNKTHKENEI